MRLYFLTVVAFGVAVAAHLALGAAGMPAESLVRIFATPTIGAVIVYIGLYDYPRASRVRVGLMVAMGLLLVALLI